ADLAHCANTLAICTPVRVSASAMLTLTGRPLSRERKRVSWSCFFISRTVDALRLADSSLSLRWVSAGMCGVVVTTLPGMRVARGSLSPEATCGLGRVGTRNAAVRRALDFLPRDIVRLLWAKIGFGRDATIGLLSRSDNARVRCRTGLVCAE